MANLIKEASTARRYQINILVILSFLPLAAIPIGENTNLPVSSVVAVTLIPALLQHARMAVVIMALIVGPLLHTSALIALTSASLSVQPAVAWALHTLPIAGYAAAGTYGLASLIRPLRIALISSCVFSLVHYAFMQADMLVFLQLYEVPGYASVADQEYAILNYIQRPFGWFPEPSFMAGTLALGAMLLLASSAALRPRPLSFDYAVIAAVCLTIASTRSGSAALTVSLIVVAALIPLRRSAWMGAMTVLGLSAAAWLGRGIISERGFGGANFSWSARLESIFAAGRYVYNDDFAWLLGTGKGALSEMFMDRRLVTSGAGQQLNDVASIIGRLFLELGLVLGLTACLLFVLSIFTYFSHYAGELYGILVLTAWIVIAGFTITYDSAALVWAVVGLSLSRLADNWQTQLADVED